MFDFQKKGQGAAPSEKRETWTLELPAYVFIVYNFLV